MGGHFVEVLVGHDPQISYCCRAEHVLVGKEGKEEGGRRKREGENKVWEAGGRTVTYPI
jgi:hypothetical protein